jgi:hypothetical protein
MACAYSMSDTHRWRKLECPFSMWYPQSNHPGSTFETGFCSWLACSWCPPSRPSWSMGARPQVWWNCPKRLEMTNQKMSQALWIMEVSRNGDTPKSFISIACSTRFWSTTISGTPYLMILISGARSLQPLFTSNCPVSWWTSQVLPTFQHLLSLNLLQPLPGPKKDNPKNWIGHTLKSNIKHHKTIDPALQPNSRFQGSKAAMSSGKVPKFCRVPRFHSCRFPGFPQLQMLEFQGSSPDF